MIEFKQVLQEVGETRAVTMPADGAAVTRKSKIWNWVQKASLQGLTDGLPRWLRHRTVQSSRLTMIERIGIGPRQALVLIEADGVRLLVATGSEGAPSFFPISSMQDANPSQVHPGHLAITPGSNAVRGLSQGMDLGTNSERPEPRFAVRSAARFGVQGRISW